jgi:hypothetical protein
MTNAPGSTGTTVTLFGASDRLDHALGTQLGERGCKTHLVTVPTGWLRTATHAIVRLDTDAGVEALRELAETTGPRSHVIAVCPELADAAEAQRLHEMCRTCGQHHDVALIVHPPVDADAVAHTVAATVADEVVEHASVGRPAFVTKAVRLDDDPH